MSEALGSHVDHEPTGRLKKMIDLGATPDALDEAQWVRQFGAEKPFDPNRKFFILQDEETLECSLYDGETYERIGWLARY